MPYATTTSNCTHPDHAGPRALPATNQFFYINPRTARVNYWCRECMRMDGRNRRTADDRRKFGVEVEFIGNGHAVAREMQARGLRCEVEGYNHSVRDHAWKIVPDQSVSLGMELVSPPLRGAAGRRQVKKACEALAAARATVNRTCGLHVHHDIHDLDATRIGRLARLWSDNQTAINGLVAPSRRDNRWAHALRPTEVARLECLDAARYNGDLQMAVRELYIDRYRALNFSCFPRYGTVEVRQHQGSINADKILAWVAFGQAMIRYAKSADALTTEPTATALVERLTNYKLPAGTATFLKGRAEFFATGRAGVTV